MSKPKEATSTFGKISNFVDDPLKSTGTIGSKTSRVMTAGALSAMIAWWGYQHYKKKLELTRDPKIATAERINFLKSSTPQCRYAKNPKQCMANIQRQIDRLQNQK